MKTMGSVATTVEHLAVLNPVTRGDQLVLPALGGTATPSPRNELKERAPVTSYIKNFLSPQNVFSGFGIPMFSRQRDTITEPEPNNLLQHPVAEEEATGVDVYMMLPLDTVSSPAVPATPAHTSSVPALLQVNADGHFRYANVEWFQRGLALVAASGVRGVAVDVWVWPSPVVVRSMHAAGQHTRLHVSHARHAARHSSSKSADSGRILSCSGVLWKRRRGGITSKATSSCCRWSRPTI
jgi:hypothetical protein